MSNLWDRQAWDTDVSFYHFQTYYLTLPANERNLQDAYRNYRASKGLGKVTPRGKLIKAPGTWRYWSEGKDAKGRRLAGTPFAESISWADRARAYDTYLIEQARRAEEDLWKKRQLDIRRTEWEVAQDLFDRAKQMRRAPVFRQTTTDVVADNGMTINRTIVIEPAGWREQDLARTTEQASRLARKSAEMDQEKVSIGDWRQELAQAGVDPDLFYDLLVVAMAAQETGVSVQEVKELVRTAATQRQR